MLIALLLQAHAATPIAGIEWTPLSRGDLVWVEEGRTSGLGVGELDGFVSPAMRAFGGAWISKQVGIVGSLGVARLTSTTSVGDDHRTRHWGVVRPAVDLRVGLNERALRRPAAWAVAGVHGDIPSARDVSSSYTEEEQALADQDAALERARLGGFGARLGLGVDYRIAEGIAIGAMWTVGWHQSVLRTDQAMTVSAWVSGNAALLLTFSFE